jgi:hypothetical protein
LDGKGEIAADFGNCKSLATARSSCWSLTASGLHKKLQPLQWLEPFEYQSQTLKFSRGTRQESKSGV